MSFDRLAGMASKAVSAAFGVDALYIPAVGSPTNTRVVVDTDVEMRGAAGRLAEDFVMLSVLRADVGIPRKGDVFDVGGKLYTVDGLPEDEIGDAYMVRVIVHE